MKINAIITILLLLFPPIHGTKIEKHNVNPKESQISNTSSAFDFYNNTCNNYCSTHGMMESIPEGGFSNPCPKCIESYIHEPCNHCCMGGVSSLKLRWHGSCGGIISLANTSDSSHCSNSPKAIEARNGNVNVKFLPCFCYDDLLKRSYKADIRADIPNCELSDEFEVLPNKKSFDDICIVSVAPMTNNSWRVDLATPLPNPLSIKQSASSSFLSMMNSVSNSADWNNYPLVTHFDTSCNYQESHDGAFPIFPGYGKFPNTCSYEGFVDLDWKNGPHFSKRHPNLPTAMEAFSGVPPPEVFWYEFIDGTSSSFWPKSPIEYQMAFIPSFNKCSCNECPSQPTSIPTSVPTSRPPQGSPTNPICKEEEYQDCASYAKANCMTKTGGDCIFKTDNSSAARQRQLDAVTELVRICKNGSDLSSIHGPFPESIVKELDLHGTISLEWILDKKNYHLKQSNFFSLLGSKP